MATSEARQTPSGAMPNRGSTGRPALPRVGSMTSSATAGLDRWPPPAQWRRDRTRLIGLLGAFLGRILGRVIIAIYAACAGDIFLARQAVGGARGNVGFFRGELRLTLGTLGGKIRCSGCRSVAQLGRASVSKTECRGFESCRSCQTLGFVVPLFSRLTATALARCVRKWVAFLSSGVALGTGTVAGS